MLVQVNFRVGDTPAWVQAVTPHGDVVPAVLRLARQLGGLSAPWRPRPWPEPTRSVLAVVGGRAISRRKSGVLLRADLAQAVAVMDAMDYDVHLFTDAESGEDAVVFGAGPAGLRLARQRRMHLPRLLGTESVEMVPLTVHPHPTATLTESEAVHRLCEHGLPFLFFTNPVSGCGHLLYQRYDGDLTLISPISGSG